MGEKEIKQNQGNAAVVDVSKSSLIVGNINKSTLRVEAQQASPFTQMEMNLTSIMLNGASIDIKSEAAIVRSQLRNALNKDSTPEQVNAFLASAEGKRMSALLASQAPTAKSNIVATKKAEDPKAVNAKQEPAPAQAPAPKPVSLANVNFISDSIAVTNVNIPDSIKNSSSQKDKDAAATFEKEVNDASDAFKKALEGRAGDATKVQSLEVARKEKGAITNAFAKDLNDFQRINDIDYVKGQILERYGNVLTEAEKAKIQGMKSIEDLVNVTKTKDKNGQEKITATGTGIGADILNRLKGEAKALDTNIATAKADLEKSKDISVAKEKLKNDVKAAEEKFMQAISESTDPYVRDVVRAMKNGGGIVIFKDEKLRASKYEIQDALVGILKAATLSPEVAKGFADRQVIADEVIKKLPKDQQELAKMSNLIATKDVKGNPVVDKDSSLLENLFVGFDSSTGSDRAFFSKAKIFEPGTMKALVGFIKYGFTDKDGNRISSGDKAKLAERWGLTGMTQKEIDSAFRSLYGSINERLDYRGLGDLKDPRKAAAVFGTVNRALNDRSDRVSEFHQKLFKSFDITKWNTTDFALMAISLGLGAKPAEAVIAGAARHDQTGVLSILSLGLAVIRSTNKERRGISNGNGSGNGNGTGGQGSAGGGGTGVQG